MSSLPRVAVLLGKGVEGCGVTRFAIELRRALGADVFELSEKRWPRRKSQELEYGSTDGLTPEKLSSAYDLLLVPSLPTKKHSPEAAEGFLDLFRKTTCPKSVMYLDHSNKSIHDCYRADEFFREADSVLTFSTEGDVAKYMEKREVSTPIKTIVNPFDYDAHRSQFWKPISAQDSRVLRWIGRTAKWKGISTILDFHDSRLRREGVITILEGLEAGPTYVFAMYYDDFEKKMPREIVNRFRTDYLGNPRIYPVYGSEEVDSPAYCYPPFSRAECMERLSLSALGSNMYNLRPEKYGDNVEFCHSEVVASGAAPVFHKHFGDRVVHRKTGDPLTKSPDSGTVWLDRETMDSARDQVVKLSRDPVFRDEQRERAFEFYRAHNDSAPTSREIVDLALRRESKSVDVTDFFS